MATVGIWKVTSNLKQVIDYTENEEKTKMDEEFNDAMSELLNYVDDGVKNDDHLFITGINCEPKSAIEDMLITKQLWMKEDGILGYHAYQSFPKDSVTPEEVHQIGVELAKEMWGDRFQVVVSTHLNTEHYHNHFVLNSVSFKDGKKYYDNRTTYAELRRLNDSICLEHGLEVLKEKPTRKHINYTNYLDNGTGDHVNYYTIAKKDIDKAIEESTSYNDFLEIMNNMNYTVTNRYEKLSIRRNDYKKNIRIERYFGEEYTIENIKKRIANTKPKNLPFLEEYYKKEFKIEPYNRKKYHGIVGLYRYYCYLLKIYPNNIRKYKLSPAMRLDVYKMDSISEEQKLLAKENITTEEDFNKLKTERMNKVTELTNEKSKLWYQIKKATNPVEKDNIQKRIDEISEELKPIRKDIKLLKNIEYRKNKIEANLKEFQEREEVNRNESIR